MSLPPIEQEWQIDLYTGNYSLDSFKSKLCTRPTSRHMCIIKTFGHVWKLFTSDLIWRKFPKMIQNVQVFAKKLPQRKYQIFLKNYLCRLENLS